MPESDSAPENAACMLPFPYFNRLYLRDNKLRSVSRHLNGLRASPIAVAVCLRCMGTTRRCVVQNYLVFALRVISFACFCFLCLARHGTARPVTRRTSGCYSTRRSSAPANLQSSRVDRVRHFAHVSPLTIIPFRRLPRSLPPTFSSCSSAILQSLPPSSLLPVFLALSTDISSVLVSSPSSESQLAYWRIFRRVSPLLCSR